MSTEQSQLLEAIKNLEKEIVLHSKEDGKLRNAFQQLDSLLTYSKVSHSSYYPIWWDCREVKDRAKDRGIKISEYVADEILQKAIDEHDPNVGLNWSIIDEMTDLFVEKQ